MNNYLKVSIGILLTLSASRFIPHPPNFTSLLALSFYVPTILGIRYLPVLLLSFVLTDLIIGFHGTTFFTWGSVVFVGLASKYFIKNIKTRIVGSFVGVCIFFVITNFGVWSLGTYDYTFGGFIICYTLAIPFFINNIISTFIFSLIIEGMYKFREQIINIRIKN